MKHCILGSATISLLSMSPAFAAEPALSYGNDVRPILSENCFYCHGQDANHRKADLRLDTAAGQKSVVNLTKPEESELVKRILATDEGQMPPKKSNRHLTAEQKEILKRWIREGARFEQHWAFAPIVKPAVPKLPGVANPIDAFIRSKLSSKGINPAPEADRATLLRRLTYDLTGLPPTPNETDDFMNDKDPNYYEKAVDRLMKSQHYGERMALPWLDAARYADSNGFQQDGDTFQWVWRDWVVKALNDNMPFDQFTIEQLAGDLLPQATKEQKIATAFNRNHLVNGEGGAIAEEQRFVILFDRVDVTATNWLGLTLACAQCHDHKYDPLTQKDYYSLMAAFNNVSENGVAGFQTSRLRVSPPFIEAPSTDAAARVAAMEKVVSDLRNVLDQKRVLWEREVLENPAFPDQTVRNLVASQEKDSKKKAERDSKLKKYFEEQVEKAHVDLIKAAEKRLSNYKIENVPKVMVMADDRPRETHILDRGEYLKPKQKVSISTPAFLPPLPADSPKNRLGIARWLVSAENPLTARVAVNRLWQTVFGTGLVRTSEDLGVQSEVPVQLELLDWLATEYRVSGWDTKKLHRLIVTSAAYKQSSRVSPEALKIDPDNRYFGRSPRYRLPAMFLRDTALAVSGMLDTRIGGKPVYPYQPEGIWDSLAITKERDFTYPKSKPEDLHRRSIYTFWRRTVGPANMFDAASRQACKVRTSITNTPLHALTTLNDPTWTEAARVLAEKLINQMKNHDERFSQAYKLILSRSPRDAELAVLRRMLEKQLLSFRKDPAAATRSVSVGALPRDAKLDPAEHAAWSAVVLAIFNLDEALTRE